MKQSLLSGAVFVAAVSAQQSAYGQCGGQGWSGQTTCVSGYTCVVSNPYYSQCLPGSGGGGNGGTPTTTSSAPSSGSTGSLKYVGVNIAGFDFGCGTDGTCDTTKAVPPLSQYGGPDGAGQMQHFVNDDHMNIFRLPVGWQWLLANRLGGSLDGTNFPKYDALVQACLNTGAYCIVDIHNYARWNGAIVGQGGPTDAQLANTWQQLAQKYAGQSRVIFGIMNEPHDIPNISTWANSVQASVTAIRNAGAKSQMILLPGNAYTAASQFIDNGSLAALQKVTNPDGTTTNLVFDVHQYLDSDNSGTHADCVTNHASDWQRLATQLRSIGRQALLSETGGGNTSSCETDLCSEISTLKANSDVLLGVVAWSAGSFDSTYVLTLTPTYSNGRWNDQPLVTQCLKR